uniref:Ubiquitin-like domain-containing protein n=1 Tax=Caenorhabditis japonica TaxID=281687 RepID=A0A8R1IZJ2_CAEJA
METMAALSQEGPSEEKVLIRLKFMNDTEKDTYASLSDTVSTFKRNNFTDLKTKIIRLIFQGQLLRDDFRTLEYYGLQPGSVVHCHISNVPYTGVRQNEYEEAERVPTRRRSQRVQVQDETNENVAEEPADPPPQFADLLTDEATRRRTAQDRNVGQIYFLLSTMLPILSGIGLAFFRPDRLRDLFRPTTLLTINRCTLKTEHIRIFSSQQSSDG